MTGREELYQLNHLHMLRFTDVQLSAPAFNWHSLKGIQRHVGVKKPEVCFLLEFITLCAAPKAKYF